MPIIGQLTLIGQDGLDEDGASLYPHQITTWNTITKSSEAGDISLFHVDIEARLTLYNIQLEGGGGSTRFSGGAIVNDGELHIYNSRIRNNRTNVYGGAIHNNGTLFILNSEMINNQATYQGSFLSSGGAGSAIYNDSDASLTAYCTFFNDNHVEPTITGGSSYVPFTIPGGAIYNKSNYLDIQYSNFIGNSAAGQNPYCPAYPSYGFCPLHIKDLASTVHVEAINNYWSAMSIWTPNGVPSITTAPTHPQIQFGDYSGDDEPCAVPALQMPTCPVTLISTTEYQTLGTAQEAMDMLAIASPDGLYLHAAPAINTPRVASTNPPWSGDPSIIPWGANVTVLARLAFNDQGLLVDASVPASFVWYQVNLLYNFDGNRDGVNEISDTNAWVMVKTRGTDNQGNVSDFQYYDTADEPCVQLDSPPNVTFPYDRQTTALYGIANSYQNNTLYRDDLIEFSGLTEIGGRATKRLVGLNSAISVPFANIVYNIDQINHSTGSSASAVFVSESIWVGGMPMTTDSTPSGDERTCPGTNDINNSGWRHCSDDDSSTGNSIPVSSRGWRGHDYIVTYFTTSSANTSGSNDILGADQGYQISSSFTQQFIANNFISCLESCGGSSPGARWEPVQLSDYFYTIAYDPTNPQMIFAGDYIWINTGAAQYNNGVASPEINHGLLVVGWGPIGPYTYNATTNSLTPATPSDPDALDIGCKQILDCVDCANTFGTVESINFTVEGLPTIFSNPGINPITIDLYISRPDDQSLVLVPYVVDFLGTLNGRTQRPIPRPFFCTRFYDSGRVGLQFTDHDWFLYHFPNQVTLNLGVAASPYPLYVPRNWTWTPTDGN